ncbi:hypothetical protein A966_01376 [Brachyspira hampsonii 30446]|uniref:Uncharacterized protein n=1 Tax=Brachyspira hampsonii 30446 TaxID=1289135 RepID=A0A2U4EXW0_9SPIR|nr:hypothetical protein A966_01376 [Brachyspira hampsonii 30446]OEJ20263.1 hypothetical protein A9495_12460 [Brachyspira hampsonii]
MNKHNNYIINRYKNQQSNKICINFYINLLTIYKAAILIDDSFFLKRYKFHKRNIDSNFNFSKNNVQDIVNDLYSISLASMNKGIKDINYYLYRIFYYDCFSYKENIYLEMNYLMNLEKIGRQI